MQNKEKISYIIFIIITFLCSLALLLISTSELSKLNKIKSIQISYQSITLKQHGDGENSYIIEDVNGNRYIINNLLYDIFPVGKFNSNLVENDTLTLYVVGSNDIVGIEKDDVIIFDKIYSIKKIERNYRLTLYTVAPLFFVLSIAYSIKFLLKYKKST